MSKKKEYKKAYFIEMNMQSAPSPEPRDWYVRKADDTSEPEFTVEDWEFTLDKRKDSLGVAEGFDPNLNFRRAFLPEEGHYWVSRDFSGQELRILTNLSKEPLWIETFLSGGDPHRATAEALWGAENYNKDRRKDAKAINFGLVYGKTARSLGEDLGISEEEAQKYMDQYFEKLPKVKKFLDRCALLGKKHQEISNIYGRKRRLKSYITPWGNLSGSGQRKSYNHPVQSFGAEVIKLALIKVYNNVINSEEYKGTGKVYFMSTIHDEINTSVEKSVVKEVTYKLGEEMRQEMPGYPVPIVTDIEIGNSMGLTWKFNQDPDTLELTPKYDSLEE